MTTGYMRVVADAIGNLRIEIECGECRRIWQSQSRSGRTTCPDCGQRIYIPQALRHEAFSMVNDVQRNDWDDLARLPAWDQTTHSPALNPDTPPARPRVPEPLPPASPGWLSTALRIATTLARDRRDTKRSAASSVSSAPANFPAGSDSATVPSFLRLRRASASKRPRQRGTNAILECGHETVLGGDARSWIGVAAECANCARHANVVALPDIGWQRW